MQMDKVYLTLRNRVVIFHTPKKRPYTFKTARNQTNEVTENLDGSDIADISGDSIEYSVPVQLLGNLDATDTEDTNEDLRNYFVDSVDV